MTPATRPLPLTRDLVLVGGGHTHALVLRKWGMAPMPGVRVTLIDPVVTTAYSGMLPGHVAGHYSLSELDIDLIRLARFAGARFIQGRAVGLDMLAGRIMLESQREIRFDVASLDIGISSRTPAPLEGETAMAAKPLGRFAARWREFLAHVETGRAAPQVIVIGGGAAGAELALAMSHRLEAIGAGAGKVTLIEADAQILGEFAGSARRVLVQALTRAGVDILTGQRAEAASLTRVQLEDGRELSAGFVTGAAGAVAQDWLGQSGLALHNGFVRVGKTLQVDGQPRLFAVGDCAHLSHAPRPKAGVFAVREAPVLFENVRTALRGTGRMREYHPQRDYLKLVSMGEMRATGSRFGLTLSGGWVWRAKDRIDRKFMASLQHFPAMQPATLPADAAAGLREAVGEGEMPCAGCGSKIGRTTLFAALSDIGGGASGDDAAVLDLGGYRQVQSIDHLRAFTDDPQLFAHIVAVHAMGDIWAMGGQPQTALANVIVPAAAPEIQADMLGEIMAGASKAFNTAGASIVGGHTSVGTELSLGFAVSGRLDRAPVTLSGACAGDVLLMTKPLGSGVILAAEMRKLADAGDVATTWQSMARPLALDATILAPLAHAMTDVTGFGLAGHLMGILRASGVGAEIELARLPLLAGAADLVALGIHSTLFPENAALSGVVTSKGARSSKVRDIVFDPQTSGGLLASLPAEAAARATAALGESGIQASQIGRVINGPAVIHLI